MKKGTKPEREFGELLREMRTAAGLSQEKLAFESGLDRSYVSMLERGLRQPTLGTIFTLSDALGAKASDIVARVEARAKRT